MGINKSLKVRLRVLFLIAALLLSFNTVSFAQSRVIAVGDVHGAYPELASILQRMGLMDVKGKWTGGSATLVQTGDVLDRGRQARESLDLLMRLERQATKAGGKVIALLGNHEVLNLEGDVRYVATDSYRSFVNAKSEKNRAQAYRGYVDFLALHRDHSHAPVAADDEAGRKKWEDEHPPGYFEYRDALGRGGEYGAWIRKHPAIVRVGTGLFLHGGLNPALPFSDIAELNDGIRSEIAAFDDIWQSLVRKKVIWRYMSLQEALRQVEEELRWIQSQGKTEDNELVHQMQRLLDLNRWMIASQDGPLWYRGLAQEPEATLMEPVKEMLGRLKAQYVVIGHTPVSKSAITTRFENRVFLIDTGMLKEAYGGRPSALEIQNGRFTAYYTDGEPAILVSPGVKTAAFLLFPLYLDSNKVQTIGP